jgi:ATP-dependent RNA helicase DeaD
LAKMARGKVPLVMEKQKREAKPEVSPHDRPSRAERYSHEDKRGPRIERFERDRPAMPKKERVARSADAGMETFRIEVGHDHGVKPGNIVGAIANEAGLDAKHIGRIEIFEDHTILDLPEGMPKDILVHLKTVWCAGQQLRITKDSEKPDTEGKKTGGKKSFGSEKPGGGKSFKPKRDFGDSPFKSGKPKAHRKGPRSE